MSKDKYNPLALPITRKYYKFYHMEIDDLILEARRLSMQCKLLGLIYLFAVILLIIFLGNTLKSHGFSTSSIIMSSFFGGTIIAVPLKVRLFYLQHLIASRLKLPNPNAGINRSSL